MCFTPALCERGCRIHHAPRSLQNAARACLGPRSMAHVRSSFHVFCCPRPLSTFSSVGRVDFSGPLSAVVAMGDAAGAVSPVRGVCAAVMSSDALGTATHRHCVLASSRALSTVSFSSHSCSLSGTLNRTPFIAGETKSRHVVTSHGRARRLP